MNRLSKEQQIRVVSALVEGNGIRATVRMTGVAKNTVIKLLLIWPMRAQATMTASAESASAPFAV